MRRVALVTGSAKRVGRTIALELARSEFDLVIHYRHSQAEAETTAEEVRALGARAEVLRADLAAVPEIENLLGTVAELYGRLDLLVNNASSFRRVRFGEVHESDYLEMLDSNLKGPFFCCQFAVPLLAAQENAQIINLLDCAVHPPPGDYLAYRAAKSALKTLTEDLARALAPAIRVNGVAPGPVLPRSRDSAAKRRQEAERTALKRLGQPEDVARTVAFLATGPDYVTGTTIKVDGGRALS